MHNFVLFIKKSQNAIYVPFLEFRHVAQSRPSISIIFLLMQLMSHEYMLYVTFFTSNIILRHPILGALKNVKFPIISEFNVVARFRETITTVKSVLSSEIQRIKFGFLTEITIFPFLRKLDFLESYRWPLYRHAHDCSV